MRHKYETRGIVLSRTPLGEANALITLLTPDLGFVHARAQGLRRPGAKLAAALATFAESSLVLVRGRESWRVAGAVLEENWFIRLCRSEPRMRAARISRLLVRLVEDANRDLTRFMHTQPLEYFRVLAALGFDAGTVPGETSVFAPALLTEIMKNRTSYITRINRGITASEL